MLRQKRVDAKYKVVIEIIAVEGKCPIYGLGDKIVLENDVINMKETKAVCLPLHATIMHSYQLHQFSKEHTGQIHKCPMIGPPRGYGYVMFRYTNKLLACGGSNR